MLIGRRYAQDLIQIVETKNRTPKVASAITAPIPTVERANILTQAKASSQPPVAGGV